MLDQRSGSDIPRLIRRAPSACCSVLTKRNVNMRIVAVEEHFTYSDLLSRIDPATLGRNGWPVPGTPVFKAINPPALMDTGPERIAAMDAAGIRMQVLSVPGPGAEIVSGADGIAIARE